MSRPDDIVVTLDMGRALRRIRNAGGPLSRHDLYHGTTGCSAADLEACLTHGLVVEVANQMPPTVQDGRGRRRPLIALTQFGLDVLRVFRFPTSGRKPKPKPAWRESLKPDGTPVQWPPDAPELFAAPGCEADAEQFLSDLVRRCRAGENVVVD